MNLLESFNVAFRGLMANKLRSSLTVLGIIIGVGAVISLMGVGRGAQATITSSIQSMGTNLLFVRPGAVREGGVQSAQGQRPTLTLEDAQALADPVAAPAVALVAPENQFFGQVVAGGQNVNTRILGVTPEYEGVRNFRVSDGEFVTQQQIAARSLVVVLGANVAETLFGDLSPVDQRIKINNRQFQVIGVLEKKGGTGMGNQDDLVVIPITTLQFRLMAQRTAQGGQTVASINVQVARAEDMALAKEQLAAILRTRHRIAGQDDFTITSQDEILGAFAQVTGVLTLFLGSIAGISLLVGGIGIMNIMLVSVTERTREIGIRKAVGAKRRDILGQFLIEATVLSLVGGGGGLLLGWGISLALARINLNGQYINALITPDIVLLAVSVSAAIGLFFGIYPASRAARLNPIDALRYE
ncbi:MAG: ABC transporter permease [Chloroflexi bacterium]|nr:ABC transporter permease [Chloroflexota bacterium]